MSRSEGSENGSKAKGSKARPPKSLQASAPRDYIKPPQNDKFGNCKIKTAVWYSKNEVSSSFLQLAWLQHRMACVIDEKIGAGEITVEKMAEKLGQKPPTLYRKLKGHGWIVAVEIFSWAEAAGIDIWPDSLETNRFPPTKPTQRRR